jgi:hypothetical protein
MGEGILVVTRFFDLVGKVYLSRRGQFTEPMRNTKRFSTRHGRKRQAIRVSGAGERGAELVEFSLILGGLMALTLAIISFARAYNVYQTVTRAAREGARMAVLPKSAYDQQGLGEMAYTASMSACTNPPSTTNSPDTPIFNQYVKPVLESSSLNPAGVQDYQECLGWLDPPGTAANQCGVIVSFQYPYRLSIPFLGAGIGMIDIHTQVQMRQENQPVAIGGAATCAGVAAP